MHDFTHDHFINSSKFFWKVKPHYCSINTKNFNVNHYDLINATTYKKVYKIKKYHSNFQSLITSKIYEEGNQVDKNSRPFFSFKIKIYPSLRRYFYKKLTASPVHTMNAKTLFSGPHSLRTKFNKKDLFSNIKKNTGLKKKRYVFLKTKHKVILIKYIKVYLTKKRNSFSFYKSLANLYVNFNNKGFSRKFLNASFQKKKFFTEFKNIRRTFFFRLGKLTNKFSLFTNDLALNLINFKSFSSYSTGNINNIIILNNSINFNSHDKNITLSNHKNLHKVSKIIKLGVKFPFKFQKSIVNNSKNVVNKTTAEYASTFLTKHPYSFILHSKGLLIPYKFLYKNKKKKLPLYRIRKKINSFLRINELKMFMFNLKKKYVLLKSLHFFSNNKNFNKKYQLTNKALYNYFNHNKNFSMDFNDNYITEEIFQKSNVHLNYKQKDFEESRLIKKDLIVPKIKFKPGYQRLWRNFRSALAESINFKYLYQQQLTRYLIKFYRRLNHSCFTQNENKIYKILVYSRLLPDKSLFNLFLNEGLIYLNHKCVTLTDIYVYKNDFIQLEITNWHYIQMRLTLNFINSRHNKFKKLVYRKSLATSYTTMKLIKQRSNYTPNWIFKVIYDFIDVKTYLEVDFFTLSVFVVYDHNFFTYTSPNDLLIVRHSLFRLYNWKYIN